MPETFDIRSYNAGVTRCSDLLDDIHLALLSDKRTRDKALAGEIAFIFEEIAGRVLALKIGDAPSDPVAAVIDPRPMPRLPSPAVAAPV